LANKETNANLVKYLVELCLICCKGVSVGENLHDLYFGKVDNLLESSAENAEEEEPVTLMMTRKSSVIVLASMGRNKQMLYDGFFEADNSMFVVTELNGIGLIIPKKWWCCLNVLIVRNEQFSCCS
jgi:hypothetical protein